MTTWKQFKWRKLFLILTALPCCRTLQVSIPEKEYEVARGGEVTLTCSFIPARPVTNTLVLTWEAFPENPLDPKDAVATYFINNPINIAPDYEGRASMEVDVARQVSTLTLTKLTMQDSRIYQCSVLIPNDDEGTTAAVTSLLVLVPPSPPICRIQGEAVYGHDIGLTCMSEEGSPKPMYEWRSYSVQNIPRQFPPKTLENDGALSFFNISRDTSGFYICTSTNRIATASCNLTLAVTPGSMNIGSTGAIIGGVVAGVVLLGIVIFCCCKKKGKKDKYAEGQVEFHDEDAPEVGKQYWDDKSDSKTTQVDQHEDTDVVPQSSYSVEGAAPKFEDDQHSNNSGKEKSDGRGSDFDSRRYEDDRDRRRGSRDRLDDERDRYGGSRDRLDDERIHYSGSRDRLDNDRERYRGSRDRLDDQRVGYGGSRDRLDDDRERYRGSRDRLDEQRVRYGGSRDRLDDQRNGYGGSRDRLDDQRNGYGGSRDRLDDHYDRSGRSHDHDGY